MSKKIDVNKYDEMKNQSDYWEIEFNKKDLECTELKQQLADKDKEIEKLRKEATEEIEFLHKQYDRCDRVRKKAVKQLKDQRHQICEKIRQSAIFSGLIRDDDEIGVYTIEKDVLDQIEKGE